MGIKEKLERGRVPDKKKEEWKWSAGFDFLSLFKPSHAFLVSHNFSNLDNAS